MKTHCNLQGLYTDLSKKIISLICVVERVEHGTEFFVVVKVHCYEK
jgi:hypothetical protein